MVWGDFQEGRNGGLGDSLLRLQKRLAGIISGKTGKYHSDPIMAELGIVKIKDLYRQQLRVHAWKFWAGKLPESQADMLRRVSDIHSYNTRSANSGLFPSTQDHRAVGYRVPKEWDSVEKSLREMRSLTSFKKKSREEFLGTYKAFKCLTRNCFVCEQSR